MASLGQETQSQGFSVLDVKNGARFLVGAVVTGFAFKELWDDKVKKSADISALFGGLVNGTATVKSEPGYIDEGAPSSIALTLLIVASLSMVAFAAIMLMERTPMKEAPKWKFEAQNAQVYVSVLALLTSAFYAGFKTQASQSIGDALGKIPAGLFLGLAILKIVEYVCCLVLLLNPSDPLYKPVGIKFMASDMDKRLEDKRHATKHAFVSLGFALATALSAALLVDCVPELEENSTDVYTGECDVKGLSGVPTFIWTGIVSIIVVLGILFLVQGFLLRLFAMDGGASEFRYHVAFDHSSAVAAYVALSGIAMQVGRGFFQQYYTELFIGANFWYYAALLFGFFGAVLLEGEGILGEKQSLRGAQISQRMVVIMAAFVSIGSAFALWGTAVLFDKLEKGGATKKGELEVYAMLSVLILSVHVVLTKAVEAFIMPELKLCGIFMEEKEEVEVTTKRSEATLALALASAVFFGHVTWEISVTLVFVFAAGARAVGYWQRFQREDSAEQSDPCSRLCAFIIDSKAEQLQLGDDGVLYGGLSLVVSLIMASVYVFRDGEPIPSGSDALRYWEFIAWLLLVVHVALTLSGLFSKVHAGYFPLVRFGASSFIIVIFSASLGEHALQDHLFPYIVPALLTYIMYDALSKARF